MSSPSNLEQLSLELINQFRADPGGEFDRFIVDEANGTGVQSNITSAVSYFGVDLAALKAQLSALSASAPLAWNSSLNDAAASHNDFMIAADTQSHNLPGELGLGARFTAAGYSGWQSIGENIYAFTKDQLHGQAGFVIDWGYDAVDYSGGTLLPNWKSLGDGIQDAAGHRANMMNTTFTEIGISVTAETDPSTNVGPYLLTQDFGTRFSYVQQLLGVVIDDQDGDEFYDIGEGMGGVTVTATSGSVSYTTITWASGGWQLEAAAGTYSITFSGGGLSGQIVKTATIGASNVKIDVRSNEAISLVPTEGNDNLVGTANNDTIYLLGGNDTYDALAGNDRVYSGKGADTIYLGDGDDYVKAGGGKEYFDGGSGVDFISYYNSSGGVKINLAANTASGSWANNDTVKNFEGVAGSKTGDDHITGTSGANIIKTYGGNDKVYAGKGADKVYLGDGDDYVKAGGGKEYFNGGSGVDFISYYNSSGGVKINLAANTASGSWAGNDTVKNFEGVAGSKIGDDHITGTSGANIIKTNGGNDKVYAGKGADTIYLGSGDDYVKAGGGKEYFDGGSGVDFISYYNSSGGVKINLSANTASGSWANNDTVKNFEGVAGSKTGNDHITGTSGANTIKTFGGNDKLYGRSGNDNLYGGKGKDRLDGGDGNDLLFGGDGADTFHFDLGKDHDTIKDFENNIDTIELDNFSYANAAEALTHATQMGNDVVFDFGNGDILTVENATKGQLSNDLDIV